MTPFKARILDTETNRLDGVPIEIAHCGVAVNHGTLIYDKKNTFNQLYSIGEERIEFGAMATHNIIDSDLKGMPHFTEFRLPEDTEYLIGHNIDYDIQAIRLCGEQPQVKAICTLALARKAYPDLDSHKLTVLMYFLLKQETARTILQNAHRAGEDVYMTAILCSKLMKTLNIQTMEQLYEVSEEARIPNRMHFGKHRGTLLKDLDSGYVKWLLRQNDLDVYLRKALEGL